MNEKLKQMKFSCEDMRALDYVIKEEKMIAKFLEKREIVVNWKKTIIWTLYFQ